MHCQEEPPSVLGGLSTGPFLVLIYLSIAVGQGITLLVSGLSMIVHTVEVSQQAFSLKLYGFSKS